MYYKIISEGQIVDACDSLSYVKWQTKNRLFLACGAEDADGIVSSSGEYIYLLEGKSGPEGYASATIAEIGEEEYFRLCEELDAGNAIADTTGKDGATDNTPAKTRLAQLEDQVAELMEQNAMLTECLLEMSEIVYGE